MAHRLTIYDIKRLTSETSPHFFERSTMRFFNQRLKDYSVCKQSDGRYRIYCPFGPGRPKGETVRYYNPNNHELERE